MSDTDTSPPPAFALTFPLYYWRTPAGTPRGVRYPVGGACHACLFTSRGRTFAGEAGHMEKIPDRAALVEFLETVGGWAAGVAINPQARRGGKLGDCEFILSLAEFRAMIGE